MAVTVTITVTMAVIGVKNGNNKNNCFKCKIYENLCVMHVSRLHIKWCNVNKYMLNYDDDPIVLLCTFLIKCIILTVTMMIVMIDTNTKKHTL